MGRDIEEDCVNVEYAGTFWLKYKEISIRIVRLVGIE